MTYKFSIFADYFQIYIETEATLDGEHGIIWSQKELDELIQVKKGGFVMGTVRDMTVPFHVSIFSTKPDIDYSNWEQINESYIEIQGGKLFIGAMLEETKEIRLEDGTYQFYALYKNLNTISIDGLEGDDEYYLYLWKVDKAPIPLVVRALKQRELP